MDVEIKRYASIDLFKFLASILVVAIHTRPFLDVSMDADYYFTCFCRIGVPFFFITSSFLFFRKDNPDIKRYTKRLLTLYLVWFVIELPIVYNRFFIEYDRPLLLQLLNFFRCFIFNNTWLASWYIMASIISVNIIYYLSRKWSNSTLLMLGVLGYVIALSCSSYSGALDLLFKERLRHYHAAASFLFMPANSFIVALIYVVFGKIIADNLHSNHVYKLGKSIQMILFVFIALLGFLEVYLMKWSVDITDAFVFLPVFTFIGLNILLDMKVNLSPRISSVLRHMSILIYILHPVVTYLNQRLLGFDYGVMLFLIALVEALIMSWVIISLSRLVTLFKYLY